MSISTGLFTVRFSCVSVIVYGCCFGPRLPHLCHARPQNSRFISFMFPEGRVKTLSLGSSVLDRWRIWPYLYLSRRDLHIFCHTCESHLISLHKYIYLVCIFTHNCTLPDKYTTSHLTTPSHLTSLFVSGEYINSIFP